ncbi:MAG: hypothetical protein GX591_09635 [Planctomycetes bacterium]|nr:hypothetical protein [Planctomycetota bacterium]
MVVREARIGLKWSLRNPEKACETASCMRFEGAVVERSGDPVGHNFFDNIALQRRVEEPGQEP